MARKKQKLTKTQAQLQKDIKRINQRITDIAKTFGTDSYAYNQYYSAVKTSLPEAFRRTTSKGLIAVSRSKEFLETSRTKATKQAIQRLLGLKTKGQLLKEAKETLKKEGLKKPTKEEITQRATLIDKMQTFVSEHSEMFYLSDPRASTIAHIKGRRKTYDELLEIVEIYERETGGDVPLDIDLFEGL